MIKPMLACDADLSKVRFPVYAQPKIDGVRAMNLDGGLTGRSLKPHGNKILTQLFSKPDFLGFDGEMAYGNATSPSLCRDTSSALSTIGGTESNITWWIFDYITKDTIDLLYWKRMQLFWDYYRNFLETSGISRIAVIPCRTINNMAELEQYEEDQLDKGYEGIILRDPDGKYKQGRSTAKEGGLLRVKRFIEEEAVVDEIVEGNKNNNEATVNELGHTARSSHKDNLEPNGMVGMMICHTIKDIEYRGKILFKKGQRVDVSAGCMAHFDRKRFFEHKHLLLGKTVKFKTFPIGVKDKPRMPTFQSVKISSDLS